MRQGYGLAGAVLLFLITPLLLQDSPAFMIVVPAAFWALSAIGLDLLMGYTGLVSLGYAAFMGISAYTSGVLSVHYHWPVLYSMGAGVVAAGMLGILILPILRLEGIYFAAATLGIGVILEEIYVAFPELTGGSSGLVDIPPLAVAGVKLVSDSQVYWVGWGVVLLCLAAILNLVRSGVGRSLLSLHEDPTAASSLGTNVTGLKMRVFLISALIAGVSGALFTHYYGYISPAQFGLLPSLTLLIMVILGGQGTLYGPVVGALVVRSFPRLIHAMSGWDHLFFGLLIVVLLLFLPNGLFGSLGDWWARRRRQSGPKEAQG